MNQQSKEHAARMSKGARDTPVSSQTGASKRSASAPMRDQATQATANRSVAGLGELQDELYEVYDQLGVARALMRKVLRKCERLEGEMGQL